MRGRVARVVLDVRLGRGDLVDDDVLVRPLDGAFELGRLVSGPHEEAVVLGADAFVDIEGHAYALAAAASLAAFAEEVEGPVWRPGLGLLAELRDALVDLAEERLVLRLPGGTLVEAHGGVLSPRDRMGLYAVTQAMTVARKAFIATAVAVGVVVLALALWKLRTMIALLFVAFIVAAAMRPGIEWLKARGVPRGVGVLLHYAALAALFALLVWLIVPRAIDQVGQVLGGKPEASHVHQAAAHSSGLEHEFFVALDKRLRHLPKASALVHPALTITKTALEVLAGMLFTLAVAAYWIFERKRVEDLVLTLVPRRKHTVIRDTWDLIEAKLGAFVRGQLLMVGFVSAVLSAAFFALGLPYWLLLGVFAGLVEMVPVVGPLIAGVVAIGVGLTQSWETAVLTAVTVYGLRLLQDYVINPRVLGRAVGLSPLIVLVTVSAVVLLFGPYYVLLSVPLAAVVCTLIEVIVLDKDPGEEPVPAVIFSARERKAS
jgi:predicted PurR-regulated permease PerM